MLRLSASFLAVPCWNRHKKLAPWPHGAITRPEPKLTAIFQGQACFIVTIYDEDKATAAATASRLTIEGSKQ